MPRYFFHIRSGDQSLSLDELGLDYPDVKAACREAVRAAQGLEEMFADRGEDPQDFALEIEDASGEIVATLQFSEIFDGQTGGPVRGPQDYDDSLRDQDGMN
jgi:hypothetical protein